MVMKRRELGNNKEGAFNLGRDNKRKTKDSLGWQDAPGVAMLLLCWEELQSCGVGQL